MSLRLAAGDVSAEVDPVAGGRLSSLVVGGRQRLVTDVDPSAVLPAVSWGSFAMLPWVGRMRDGRLAWRGTTADLPPDFGAHAIHGATFDVAWQVLAATDRSVELGCDLGTTGRWPFDGDARQSLVLRPDGLDLRVEVRARAPMPVAVGWHPWFQRDGDEPISVVVPARGLLETTDELIPTGAVVPLTSLTDLRRPRALGGRRLDHAYVGGSGPCVVSWSDLELVVSARPLRSVVVYTTPRSVCVEPQTAWPDAIRLDAERVDTGLVALSAGETFVAESTWSWRGLAG